MNKILVIARTAVDFHTWKENNPHLAADAVRITSADELKSYRHGSTIVYGPRWYNLDGSSAIAEIAAARGFKEL